MEVIGRPLGYEREGVQQLKETEAGASLHQDLAGWVKAAAEKLDMAGKLTCTVAVIHRDVVDAVRVKDLKSAVGGYSHGQAHEHQVHLRRNSTTDGRWARRRYWARCWMRRWQRERWGQ